MRGSIPLTDTNRRTPAQPPPKMDYEFIEEQITETKRDLAFNNRLLKEALATQEALETIEGDIKEKLVIDARDNVKRYGKRIDHDYNMLDVLYSARDLTKK